MNIATILGYLLFAFVLLNYFRSISVIRKPVRKGIGITKPTVNVHMLSLLSLIIIPLLGLSPFHLAWMIPLSFLIGYFSYIFPLSILNILGSIYARIICLGINYRELFKEKIVEQEIEDFLKDYTNSIDTDQQNGNTLK